MGAVIGLAFGIGVLLVWRSGPRAPERSVGRFRLASARRELLRQAGVDGIGSGQLSLAQVGCALLVGLLVLVVTHTVTVALCFAAFAFVALVMVLRRLRR